MTSLLKIAGDAGTVDTGNPTASIFDETGGMLVDDVDEGAPVRRRFAVSLDRIETIYLGVLRAAVLLLATVLLVVALGWLATSLYKMSRSPTSVVEKPAEVSVEDVLPRASDAVALDRDAVKGPKNTPEQERFYRGAVNRYHALFQQRYQPYQRADDKKLSASEYDDLTLNTTVRLAAIRNGELNFATDRVDVDAYLKVIGEAAARPETSKGLSAYRDAKKVPVTEQVLKSRQESRSGWNRFSQNCELWYEAPIGCSEKTTVDVPYVANVTTMKYPANLASPIATIKGAQDRFFDLLGSRRRQNAADAGYKREEIIEGNATGRVGLTTTVMILGAFLVLMFFFLLVAIERHQRQIVGR